MAAVLDSFVKRCTASLEDFADQEACAALGIVDDVRGLLATLLRIDAIISHEERRRVLSAKTDAWVVQVKDAMYEIDDVLDVCMIEGAKILAAGGPPTPKVRCFFCFKLSGPRKFRHEIGFTIRDIDLRLREVEEEMPRLPAGSAHSDDAKRDWFSRDVCKNCSDAMKPQAVGSQVQKAVGGLVPRMLREGKKKVDVFAIVGAVGIGKTTLAREIYNDDRMTENFPICVWVDMSKNLSELDFLKTIIRGAGANVGVTENKEELLILLASALSKRFLLVLDDLESPSIWDNLLKDSLGDGVVRGRILITTRNEEVATSMKATIHHVDKMDPESAWALLCNQVDAECNSEELATLKDVGIKIAEKCDGHPLAIKVIAGILRSRGNSKAEWEMVLNNDSWSMCPILPEVPQAVYVSYVDLSSQLKECFLHCSLYPEEFPIQRFALVRRWIAEGIVNARDKKLLEESAQEYYVELISRNLLQPDPESVERCWITHHLLRSLARALIADESILIYGQQKLNTSLSKPRHLTLCSMENSLDGPISLKQQMGLRSLMLFKSPNVRAIDLLMESASCLRVLDLSHDNNAPEGCDLDDLKALSELRHLHIESLDRATSGASALANKPFLEDLYLSEQAPAIENQEDLEDKDETEKEEKEGQERSNGQCRGDESTKASEKIWNELTPPQSIKKLVIKNYKGVKFPKWIKGPKLGDSFPSLVFLDLENCMSCTKLPSLGLLSQLQSLQISNADSVITIGSEFLGTTVLSSATPFPKLEVLKLRNMKKLEEWSLTVEESQVVLPCLKSLQIQWCPKLKALPEGLKHVALCELHVEGAHSLTEIKDLPKLSDELHLKDNKVLQRISNLPMLRSLIIDDCSKLKHVAGLDALQHLRLVFPPSTETFYFEELVIFWSVAFPRWLELLIQKCKGLRRFELQCGLSLLRSCLDGGKNWHLVQQIPEVRIISCDGKRYFRYNKSRRIYETNAQSEE
ncbi:Disease resistance RPP13-like protein 4 [Zea mays]|uniref:Disease resistance RPP13-like protein 4 n=1 Tax=Zea mays TaxID=4577 RepID=A0A1D6GX12_MAIZE|nr:Disease resistance RPP13-like protein 4 [Zea mays]